MAKEKFFKSNLRHMKSKSMSFYYTNYLYYMNTAVTMPTFHHHHHYHIQKQSLLYIHHHTTLHSTLQQSDTSQDSTVSQDTTSQHFAKTPH